MRGSASNVAARLWLLLAGARALVLDGRLFAARVVADVCVWNHITLDGNGHLFYRDLRNDMYLLETDARMPYKIKGVEAIAHDSCLDKDGSVLIGASDGIYKYEQSSATAVLHAAQGFFVENMFSMENGSIVFDDESSWYELQQGASRPRRLSQAARKVNLAYNSRGDLIFGMPRDHNSPYLLRRGSTVPAKIQGLPSGDHFMNVFDRYSGNVYMCNSKGLYFVRPDSHEAERVDGLGNAIAIAFDRRGDIYIGTTLHLLKLSPNQSSATETEDPAQNSSREWSIYKLYLYVNLLRNSKTKPQQDGALGDTEDVSDHGERTELARTSVYWMLDVFLTAVGFLIIISFFMLFKAKKLPRRLRYRATRRASGTLVVLRGSSKAASDTIVL